MLCDQVTWSKDARQRRHEDNLCAWLSLDEASYEEDARLKTEEPEEEDEKERDERAPGMSTVSINKLQVLWDHFIHAEPQSYEKSSWLDIFLAELLAQIKEGKDVKDVLSCCSVGVGGVSTLVACELLSDVHELCGNRNDGGELIGLRKYLVQDRGWRYLAVLHLLGVRGLSCGRELVALLVALYQVAFQEGADSGADLTTASQKSDGRSSTRNQYIRFHCNDNTVDTVNIVLHAKRKSAKSSGRRRLSHEGGDTPSRRRFARRHAVGAARIHQTAGHRQKQPSSVLEARRNTPEDETSSECEPSTDGVDPARSLTLKIRLNPMDFEYFTSIVRSDEEQKWQAELYELPPRPVRKTPRDYIDERIRDVLDADISNFEISLLIVQLLQGLRDYDTPAEQTPAVQVLKFALDTLWSLQFGIDGSGLNGTESATLKAAAARLMLTALERALRADEPTTAVIHNGLLPMTLRLLENACGKPVNALEPEEGSLLQEFIFATIYGIVTFLYCLLHQRGGSVDKLSDFLELFRLFVESQDGRLVERTIFAIVDLPSVDPTRSIARAEKIIDIIGALTSGLKRVRRDLSHATQCHRTKHKSCIDHVQSHHHSDVLGAPYSQSIVGVADKQACCVSSLFATLTSLLKESHLFASELQVKLIGIITAAGTCCCLPPKTLLSSVVACLRKRDPSTYAPAVAFLERTLFRELGAYSTTDTCDTCDRPVNYSWNFLELYIDLLSPDDPRLCYIVMAHLLKVTPGSRFHVREQLLFRVFYPTFLRAKARYTADKGNATARFLLQSSMSVISCLIVNLKMCEKFMETNGLHEILSLIADAAFTRSVYALLEVTVTVEIWRVCKELNGTESIEAPATKFLFETLDRETNGLLASLQCLKELRVDQQGEKELPDVRSDYQSAELSALKDSRPQTAEVAAEGLDDTTLPQLPESDIHREQPESKTDTTNAAAIPNSFEKSHFVIEEPAEVCDDAPYNRCGLHQASAAWRAAAGVALCSPKFRTELSAHSVSRRSLRLFKLLTVGIATDSIEDKPAHKLFEALITCCLISPLYDCDIVMELAKTLMSTGITLGRGVAVIVDAMLKVSMLKPAQENSIQQQSRPRLPTVSLETLPDYGAEDSSTGEYVTADDGYEADIEVPGKNTNNNAPKKSSSPLGPVIEPRGHANAHPALCSLAIDLLIHFSEQGLDFERGSIITGGLRRVTLTCRESVSSCAALAASGTIMKILNGFKGVFTDNDPRYRDLQHAALEVFTLLATQSISPTELVAYLSFFKVKKPPLLPLLEPLYHLVLAARPQPNFILSFPAQYDVKTSPKIQTEEHKNLEKAENLVNNFRKKHLAAGICSPWSVHATCLPVGPELAWSVWLHGCSASMWLRIERGLSVGGRTTAHSTSPLLNSDSESLSDWGILSDDWSRDDEISILVPVVAGSVSPPMPTSIIHLMSIGFESLVLETWLDLRSDKLILRLTRPDDKINRTISETSINGMLPSGCWHHLTLNIKDTVLNKRSAVVEVTLWVDGWKEVNAQLPFDGLLVRKPGTTCILLGQIGSSSIGAWYLGNLMIFRCPVFTKERALHLAGLGPNYTNLADCILNTVKPDFAPLIASGALNGVREVRYEGGKFDLSRRKSYGGTFLRHAVETVVSESKIDWDVVMDVTNSHLGELQDNLLLSYEAQNPNVLHLYPQAVANPAVVVRSIFPGQPGFRVVSVPEHKVSQQPPLSISPIVSTRLESQQYRGLVPAAILVGGVPVFSYLFARVVELSSTEEEQALALSIILHLVRSDSELLNQYRSDGGTSLILRVLESSRCHAGRHILKAILDAACDSSIIIKDIGSGNHSVSQNCEAVIIDPGLIKGALTAWRAWVKYDTLNLLLQALLLLLRDQHSHREFNASQLNRVGVVDTILTLCKEHFMYEMHEEENTVLDSNTGIAIVELMRALMGAPPEFAHLVAITDYLVLVHQASETYVTHSRHNIYFMLPQLKERNTSSRRSDTAISDDSIGMVENSKLNKALTNEQIQKTRSPKKKDRKNVLSSDNTSAGEDSGIAGSDGSNPQSNERQSTYADERRACQGLVCEGLLLLLRDAVRVLPDCQVGLVLKHVLRAELLLVLANDPDNRVRTALIKVIQTYLQRASDEEVNKFIKQKYFMHLGNQIALYPGSESLIVALENLALRGPTLAAMPPLMAMIAKAAGSDSNVVRPIISFVTDIIAKNTSALRVLLEQGLIESMAQALVAIAHKGTSSSLHRDIHVLFVAIATKLLELPGNHQMQAVLDLHMILDYMELSEKLRCRVSSTCTAVRDAQVALFDGELDLLTTKMSNPSGFRLRSTASYLASASYFTSVLTTSSEQSDHGSRSSSYANFHTNSPPVLREPSKGELNDRFRIIVTRACEFIMAADASPSVNELQLTRRLFSILLHGLCSPLEKKNHWGNTWSVRSALRKYTARIMVWLLEPHQSINTRIYAIRSLMEEPRAREILSCILEVHPQMEQKFTVFFWDLLQKRDEMPSADARVCAELREALRVWNLAKGIEQASPEVWNDELALLRRDLLPDQDICIDNYPAILRIGKRFDTLAKQLTESAMTITRSVVEEQNRERKVLMEQLKHTRALEAQAVARWRDIAKRLTHERAPWHFPESYPKNWELDPTEGPARVRIRLQRCHLNIDKKFVLPEYQDGLASSNAEMPLSYLFTSAREDTNTAALIERLHTSEKIRKMSQAKVVTPRAELAGEVLIGETCVYFVPDNPDMPLHTDIALGGFDLAVAGGTAWRLEDIRELHRRRYQLQERAIEIFLITGRTYLLAFNSAKERDEFTTELSACNLPRRIPGDDLGEALALWRSGALTNWEYITCLNKLAGRSYNDLMQYPVFPFVLADYVSEKIDLNNPKIYRNFKRPMAVQDKKNEQHYINNYNYLKQTLTEGFNLIALNQGPFHYGSHYSNSGTVLHFLVRLPPFTSMFLCYQDNNFDIPDRTFHALATTWRLTSCDSTTDVKELIPEFFYLPEFLLNFEGFNFGVRQNGNKVGDVELPKWCGGDARLFILAHRAALESDIVREVLPYWIDLVFGFRQTGRPAIEAINVFHPATYYGFDVEQITDPLERQAWETMVRTYGQTPAQLFRAPHPLIQNLGNITLSNQTPQVIEGIDGIKWGNYVGAPGNEPVLCWKLKHKTPLASLVPLATGDVFGLPNHTTLLLGYTKEKGSSMLSGMSVLGVALASWSGTDGIARLKCKKEQPPKPLIKSSGLDPITTLASTPDCGQLWVGHLSGRITVHAYTIGSTGKIEFSSASATVLLAHSSRVTVISLSRTFSVACSGDGSGVIVIWDLNSLTYVRSIVRDQGYAIHLLCISETLGDVAATCDIPRSEHNASNNQSELTVHTVNARAVGSILSRRRVTALCYSNAPEGVSVNVVATGLDNGIIRLWSSWDLQLVREISSNARGCGAIIAVAWPLDQHHLYAVTEDSTVLIWEGSKRLSNGTPKFVNLTSY
ncbi:PREDICTED: lysosomal-trafficking regulator isoform X3 [Vollenhovia emeryi]|uniref:lysosomal-trafficking regulator isoform X3 n=1 Tax=Vollenhovia emeryi TaxID=411798 RepID=UPI0005F54E0F|nr:PREDICTED: lysosomal-trafficking regulator isoform X3 [Vollenhovia emeryi]